MYDYEYKKQKIERENKIIIFSIDVNMKKLNYNITNNVFIYNTFKIIPLNIKPYKLMVIYGLPNPEKIPLLLSFVIIKYIYSYDK